LFVLGVALVIWSNLITYQILGEVNDRLESDQQFSYLFVQFKWAEILDRYR